MNKTFFPHFILILSASGLILSVPGPRNAAAEQESASKNHKLASQASAPLYALPATIAQVNGVPITAQDFWSRLMREGGMRVLNAMIDDALIEQEGARIFSKGKSAAIESEVDKVLLDFTKQFGNEEGFQAQLKNLGMTPQQFKSGIRRDIYKRKLMEDSIKITASEIERYYEKNSEALAEPEKILLKHILVATEEEAKSFLLALSVGANFKLLAERKSLDAATKNHGGTLGWFARGELPPAIEQKAFGLPPGETDIVATPMGFHIIRVSEKSLEKAAVLDKKTRDRIEQILRQNKMKTIYPAFIEKLRAKSKITVYTQP